jgi:hypothetical protein
VVRQSGPEDKGLVAKNEFQIKYMICTDVYSPTTKYPSIMQARFMPTKSASP